MYVKDENMKFPFHRPPMTFGPAAYYYREYIETRDQLARERARACDFYNVRHDRIMALHTTLDKEDRKKILP